MTFYRIKLWVKEPGAPDVTVKRRQAVRELIDKHGGRDASASRSSNAYAVGVFTERAAAKEFRAEARARLAALA